MTEIDKEFKGLNLFQGDLDLSILDRMQKTIEYHSPDVIKEANRLKREVLVGDSVSNFSQQTGLGTNDFSFTGLLQVSNRGKSWQLNAIDQAMRDVPYFINGANWKATVATRNGIDINSKEILPERLTNLHADLKKLNKTTSNIIFEGEFYGFCAGLLVIKGQNSKRELRKPLDITKINKGDFLGIKPLTRLYQIAPEVMELLSSKDIENIPYWGSAEKIGMPKYYRVNLDGNGTINELNKGLADVYTVHASRIIVYRTNHLSYIENKIELNMGVSMLERVYSDLARYETLLGQTVKMAQRANTPVLKTEGIAMTTLNDDRVLLKLLERMKLMKQALTSSNMVSISENEDFTFHNASFQDVPNVLKELKENLASSIGAPYSVISHGKEVKPDDEKPFYPVIERIQTLNMRDWYEVLIPILYRNRYNEDIPDFSFNFKSLDRLSQKEKAEVLKIVVDIITGLWSENMVDLATAHRMLETSQTNVEDIVKEIDEKYIKYANADSIVQEGIKNKISFDIALAEALNQGNNNNDSEKTKGSAGVKNPISSVLGEAQGGNKEKPTPKIRPEKE